MTTTNTIRNRVMYALALHDIEQAVAESIWTVLSTGDDPQPAHLPAQIEYFGHTLPWPAGNGRRVLSPDERRIYNDAIIAAGGHDTLDKDATASHARVAFEHMHKLVNDGDPTRQGRIKCGYPSPSGLRCIAEPHGEDTKHRSHSARWATRPTITIEHKPDLDQPLVGQVNPDPAITRRAHSAH